MIHAKWDWKEFRTIKLQDKIFLVRDIATMPGFPNIISVVGRYMIIDFEPVSQTSSEPSVSLEPLTTMLYKPKLDSPSESQDHFLILYRDHNPIPIYTTNNALSQAISHTAQIQTVRDLIEDKLTRLTRKTRY